jgi:hypothetical protein
MMILRHSVLKISQAILRKDQPFGRNCDTASILQRILDRDLPSLPESMSQPEENVITSRLWAICHLCWIQSPLHRPRSNKVSMMISEYRASSSIISAMSYFILPGAYRTFSYKLLPRPDDTFAFLHLKALTHIDPFGTFLRTQVGPGEGFRITADALRIAFAKKDSEFGEPPGLEKDGGPPKDVYFTSASYNGSLTPGKGIDFNTPTCQIPWDGSEIICQSYSILRFDRELMELVPASGGEVPVGRRPVVGGYSDGKNRTGVLYHAVGVVNSSARVPGKAAKHLVFYFFLAALNEAVVDFHFRVELCYRTTGKGFVKVTRTSFCASPLFLC